MGAFLHSMAWPFAVCLVLTGIHVYLGIHVLARKVIFVDLALAQIAALGTTWGVLLGWDVHEDALQIKGFSLFFAVVGAAVFSLTRARKERVPHEAIIGITYAVAFAATILFSANLAHGAEEVKELLTGSILWVTPKQVLSTAALYAVLGGFHYAFRKRFLLISHDSERAEAQGIDVRLWDFLFYVSFGFVVTSSVSIAGVLLVFSYLVIPSVVAALFADSVRARLLLGWTVGTLVSAFGVSLSYFRDLPSGPTIVVSFGGCLALAGVIRYVTSSPQPVRAFLRAAGGGVVLVALLGGSFLLRKREHHDLLHVLETGARTERMHVLAQVEAQPELWQEIEPATADLLTRGEPEVCQKLLELVARQNAVELLPSVHALLRSDDDLLREEAIKTVRRLARPESAQPLAAAAAQEKDEYLRVELGEALLELGDPSGVPVLLDVMASGEAREARRDAFEHLGAHVPLSLPYDASAGAEERAERVRALREWWQTNGKQVEIRHLAVPPEATASDGHQG